MNKVGIQITATVIGGVILLLLGLLLNNQKEQSRDNVDIKVKITRIETILKVESDLVNK